MDPLGRVVHQGAAGSHELTHQAQIITAHITSLGGPDYKSRSTNHEHAPRSRFKLPGACGPGRPAKGEKRGGSSSPRSSSKGKDSQPASEPTNRLPV